MKKKDAPIIPWSIGALWSGEDCFIVCGGTSVEPALVAELKGRPRSKVIAINSSYLIAPFADILFFGDDRWWWREFEERPALLEAFGGECVTVGRQVRHRKLRYMDKVVPSRAVGLTREPTALAMETTSLQGALNIALHKRARRIILIGADNREGADGRYHHHAEYPWPVKHDPWTGKTRQLAYAVPVLADAGIEVINASLISTFPWWPKVDLATWLTKEASYGRQG